MKMKKLVLFIFMLFLMACSSPSREIKQNISFDNIRNTYSVTTSFGYPYTYNACVYCEVTKIDSVKDAEYIKAEDVQSEMIKNLN